MKIVSWNIKWGGGTRSREILDVLVVADPDVIVLGEYKQG